MDRIEEFAQDSFRRHFTPRTDEERYANLLDCNALQHFLVGHISNALEQEVEIPVVFKDMLNHAPMPMDYYFPLRCNSREQIKNRRLANTIFRDFMSTNSGDLLQGIKTSKGERISGTQGVILNNNMEILCLCTLVYKFAEGGFRPTKAKFYIHPRALVGESLIGNTLVKKIVPFLASLETISVNSNYNGYEVPIEICISRSCDNFVEKPVSPTPSHGTDEVFNDIVANFADKVIHL